MRKFILPYNPASESAKLLAGAIGCKRIKRERSNYRYKKGDVIINWGCSNINNPEVLQATIINLPEPVRTCSNKGTFFTKARQYVNNGGAPIFPDSTTDYFKAVEWLNAGETVVERHLLNGHSGEGIQIIEPGIDALNQAPLYTKYQKKTDEFRIHFSGGEIIKAARKGRKRDVPDDEVNWKVRNLAGGFVYGLYDLADVPDRVLDVCELFMEETELDFGAIDVIYHRPTDKALVLEVNTAPGLSGTTIEAYAESFKKVLGQ